MADMAKRTSNTNGQLTRTRYSHATDPRYLLRYRSFSPLAAVENVLAERTGASDRPVEEKEGLAMRMGRECTLFG